MAEQTYSNPPSRNPSNAAGIPNKVSVPEPGTDKTQKPYTGGMKQTPAGFDSGLINGKC